MHDNFSKALKHFITEQIFADQEQTTSFEEIRNKLHNKKVNLLEICCDLTEWVLEFEKQYNENPHKLQFEFDNTSQASSIMRQLLIKQVPESYYGLSVYAVLERYQATQIKQLNAKTLNTLNKKLEELKLLDFFVFAKELIRKSLPHDKRRLKIIMGENEKVLLTELALVAKDCKKAMGIVEVPVTKFFAQPRVDEGQGVVVSIPGASVKQGLG